MMGDEKNWYAIYVRSRCEKKVYNSLSKAGIEAYLPMYSSIRQWADREKKLDLPLFKGYVFVYLNINDLFKALESNSIVLSVSFNGIPAQIPEDQIIAIKQMLSGDYEIESLPLLKEGNQVEVIAGPL